LLEAARLFLESHLGLTPPLQLLAAVLGVVGGLWTVGKIAMELKAKWSARNGRRNQYAAPPETVEEADHRIQEDPRNPSHHISRAELLSDQGHFLEALGASDRALAMRKAPEALEARSRINLEAGNFDDAIADAELAIRLGASKIDTAFTIGHALRSKGDFLAAEKQADKMLELGDPTERPFWLRALTRIQQDKLQEALPDVLKVIRTNENNPDARLIAASLHLDLGDPVNAISQYEKVVDLGVGDADMYRNLGDAYMMTGDHDQAKATYHQALAFDPNHQGAKEALQSMNRSRVAAISRSVLNNIVSKVSWSR
jgi:tetratricopeptide (TPR) repeat protein